MKDSVKRLSSILSYNELACLKMLAAQVYQSGEKNIVLSTLTKKLDVTRSIMVSTTKLATAAGIIETQSMGSKGMHIKVLDAEALSQIMEL